MPADPWSDLLPETGVLHPIVLEEMLRLIAYDIADPARLRRVAEVCENYGVRVQKSLFECWLEEPRFDRLWSELNHLIDLESDALAAYVIDRAAAPRRRVAGRRMVSTKPRQSYIL